MARNRLQSFLSPQSLTAILIMCEVAKVAPHRLSAEDIETLFQVSKRGLELELQALVRRGLLTSRRGPRGGYGLTRNANAITCAEVVRAVDHNLAIPASKFLSSSLPLLAEVDEVYWSQLTKITLLDLLQTQTTKAATA